MKKIYSGIILFIVLVFISNLVFATEYWEKENKKREEACKLALDSYMKTFMTEETPEEDRIKEYTFSGYGIAQGGEDENKLYMHISVNIIPVNESNTTWSKLGDICFVVFSKVNNEYIVDRISRYPDNYEKFLEKFEEYKKKDSEIISKEATIQGKGQNNLASQEIQKINNSLIIGLTVSFIISSTLLAFFIRKDKKK